ncbi:MAG: hypothetical protein Q6373_000260 [Candidatus Sigynarchaeota archaeon]
MNGADTLEAYKRYKILLDGIAEWGGTISTTGIVPEQPQTWTGHVPTLDANLPAGKWRGYVQDPVLAATDQLSFRNHVILALAAEKTRVLAMGGVPQTGSVTLGTKPMYPQSNTSAQQLGAPVYQHVAPGSASRVDELLNEARGYRRAGKWALAKDAYSQVLALQPGNPEAKEGMTVSTQKASMKMLAIMMPLMCGGMIAFVLIFLYFALKW